MESPFNNIIMNKSLLTTLSVLTLTTASALAQGAFDGMSISQQDMKGTARFMSMGGAFGALGGDLSTLSQNPAGIGVYRRGDIGFTVDLDCQSATSKAQGMSYSTNQTKFLLNNIGAVFTYRLDSEACPNINFGFTYNKGASFNRAFRGNIRNLNNSMTNYIAGVTQNDGCTVKDVETTNQFDPYNPNDGGFAPAWISVLGYDGYLITPQGDPDSPTWIGQWGNETTGSGSFDLLEKGSIDEYNISIGGNIANVVYWGMDFDIIDLNYSLESLWGENLNQAYVNNHSGIKSDWDLYNYYRISGTGFNYKLGLIFKPINEFRLGFAVHTPTWYRFDQDFYGDATYNYQPNPEIYDRYNNPAPSGQTSTNNGYTASNQFKFTSPWRFIASAAVVVDRFLISADYEWTSNRTMKFKEADYYYYDDWGYDWFYKPASRSFSINDPYYYTNEDVKTYFQNTSTIRLGAEFRVLPQFSLRAGYSYSTSPIKESVRNNQEIVYTAGTRPQYITDNSTTYLTGGFGYRYKKFYLDMAYVWKHRTSDFHAYTPDPSSTIQSPQAEITQNNSQIVLTMGFKF